VNVRMRLPGACLACTRHRPRSWSWGRMHVILHGVFPPSIVLCVQTCVNGLHCAGVVSCLRVDLVGIVLTRVEPPDERIGALQVT
jgi:hypothetical protein